MTAAEWDDLARLAEAATPGDWEVRRDSGCSWIAAGSDEDPTVIADYLTVADAEFIAAANPTTILRLIRELQVAERKARGFAYDLRITEAVSDQRAARLAAVEALVAEWERVQEQNRKALGELARGTSHLLLDTPGPADFRAALAAPTVTTKENNR